MNDSILDDDQRRILIALLVRRSGIPASATEVEGLLAGAPAVEASLARLYAVAMDHETEPAVELTQP